MAKDIRFTCISAQQSGDQFAFETETHGTNTGAVGGFPATGKAFVLRGVWVGKRTPAGQGLFAQGLLGPRGLSASDRIDAERLTT